MSLHDYKNMFIDIEFFEFKEDITLYYKEKLDVNVLVKQLVKAEIAAHPITESPSNMDKFIETMLEFGWELAVTKESPADYWFDRDTFILGRLHEEKDGYVQLKTNFEKLYRQTRRKIKKRKRELKKRLRRIKDNCKTPLE